MSYRNEDLKFRDLLKSVLKRLDILENGGSKAKRNDIRLGDLTVGTDKNSGKVQVTNEMNGQATLLGKDEDAKWSYAGTVAFGAINDSPPHVMSESLTAIEIVTSIVTSNTVTIPITVTFVAVNNNGVSSGPVVINASLPANKNVWVTPINISCKVNSIIYVSLLTFTPTVAPTNLSVFVRFGSPEGRL